MRATQAQLSPIFGLYSDPDQAIGRLLGEAIDADEPTFIGRTSDDKVLHEVWAVDDAPRVAGFQEALETRDLFIADGHHRYNTALNHYHELNDAGKPVGNAAYCLFVMIAMQDPGMIVLPTHRVLGNMPGFTIEAFKKAAESKLLIQPVAGKDPALLEDALAESNHPHAIGLYDPSKPDAPLSIATTIDPDPLNETHGDKSDAWRQLDVAIVQHLIVEQICEPTFVKEGDPGATITWKFPHEIAQLKELADTPDYQLGLVLRSTPLDSVPPGQRGRRTDAPEEHVLLPQARDRPGY